MPKQKHSFTTGLITTLVNPFFHELQEQWSRIKHWDSRKNQTSFIFSFFSPSLILIFFSFLSQCSQSTFPFLSLVLFISHILIKLTTNPISTTLHYQILYKYIVAFLILFFTPSLPKFQLKFLAATILPIYFQILTGSIIMTLIIIFPSHLLFFLCFSQEPIANPKLLFLSIVMPAFLWVHAGHTKLFHQEMFIPKKEPLGQKTVTAENLPLGGAPLLSVLQADQDKILLGISHDCRNLLSSLKAILTLMKDEFGGQGVQTHPEDDNLQSAIAIAEHLTLLLTNLLNYLKSPEDNNVPEEMRLTNTLEKIWLMISPSLKKKKLNGQISIKKGSPLSVLLDEKKFMGILLNLIGNAVKFTDSGNIKVNVYWQDEDLSAQGTPSSRKDSTSVNDSQEITTINPVFCKSTFFDRKDADAISFNKKCFTALNEPEYYQNNARPKNGCLVVTIQDTGCGIDEESLKKLFNKYIQVGSDSAKRNLGLGLGLWYTKHLLSQIGGNVDFRSSKNVGTWVRVTIPCHMVESRPRVENLFPQEEPRFRVFIRDDDQYERYSIQTALKKRIAERLEIHNVENLGKFLDSDLATAGNSVLIIDQRSLLKEGYMVLDKLEKLSRRKVSSIVFINEPQMDPRFTYSQFGNVQVISKPIRNAESEEIANYVEAAIKSGTARTSSSSPAQDDQTPQVLVVDDEKLSLMMLQGFFKKNSVPCLVAEDGSEAVEIYKKNKANIKVVFMDSQMPKMNGLEASKAIRKLGSDKLKIFGLTGDDSDSFKQKAKESGMNGVFLKPARLQDLLQEVSSHLKAN